MENKFIPSIITTTTVASLALSVVSGSGEYELLFDENSFTGYANQQVYQVSFEFGVYDKVRILSKFAKKLTDNSEELPLEVSAMVNDHLFDILL